MQSVWRHPSPSGVRMCENERRLEKGSDGTCFLVRVIYVSVNGSGRENEDVNVNGRHYAVACRRV